MAKNILEKIYRREYTKENRFAKIYAENVQKIYMFYRVYLFENPQEQNMLGRMSSERRSRNEFRNKMYESEFI